MSNDFFDTDTQMHTRFLRIRLMRAGQRVR
jgi:hypothetical protein